MKGRNSWLVAATVVGLVTAAAGAARATETGAAADADIAAAGPPSFGRPGSVVVGVSGVTAQRQELGGPQVVRNLAGELAVSAIVRDGWSLGAGLLLGYGKATDSQGSYSTTTAGVEARGGRLTALSRLVSWWPQLGVGWSRASASSSDPTVTVFGSAQDSLLVDLDVPVLLHPGAHFFVAAGPGLRARFSSDAQAAGLYGRVSFGWSI